jgi:hypothetical protein
MDTSLPEDSGMEEKILTQHPQGKQGVNISRAKYETVRSAIIESLRTGGPMTFTDLERVVSHRLAGNFDGSIAWYVTTVKLDLEARQIIKPIPKTTPPQLRLVAA